MTKYTVHSINEKGFMTDADMRKTYKFIVAGPSNCAPDLNAFWPFETEAQAVEACRKMNEEGMFPSFEEDWKPGEEAKAMKVVKK
jgi:hypothetical protein